jgi:hypothetical protein
VVLNVENGSVVYSGDNGELLDARVEDFLAMEPIKVELQPTVEDSEEDEEEETEEEGEEEPEEEEVVEEEKEKVPEGSEEVIEGVPFEVKKRK